VRPWRRVLYEKQNYPDDYVSDKFLGDLDLRPVASPPTTLGIFIASSVVAQQVTSVVIFIGSHKYIRKHESVGILLAFDSVMLLAAYLAHVALSDVPPNMVNVGQITAFFLICLRIVSPVLQTLTSSYTNDTIDALVIVFATIHLVFYDYAYVNNTKEIFTGVLSLTAVMFTAVMLASRLQEIEVVTVFSVHAVISFLIFPDVARLVKRWSLPLHLLMLCAMWLTATIILYYLDFILFVVYQASIVFISVICPPCLSYFCSNYKKAMKGPWDIAQLPLSSEIPMT